jgi:hypothetical protein
MTERFSFAVSRADARKEHAHEHRTRTHTDWPRT